MHVLNINIEFTQQSKSGMRDLLSVQKNVTSKEMYSPLTSPIMIPISGFPEPKKIPNQLTSSTNGGWASPLSAGGLTGL